MPASNFNSNDRIYIQVTIRDCIFLRISPGSFQVKRTKEVILVIWFSLHGHIFLKCIHFVQVEVTKNELSVNAIKAISATEGSHLYISCNRWECYSILENTCRRAPWECTESALLHIPTRIIFWIFVLWELEINLSVFYIFAFSTFGWGRVGRVAMLLFRTRSHSSTNLLFQLSFQIRFRFPSSVGSNILANNSKLNFSKTTCTLSFDALPLNLSHYSCKQCNFAKEQAST